MRDMRYIDTYRNVFPKENEPMNKLITFIIILTFAVTFSAAKGRGRGHGGHHGGRHAHHSVVAFPADPEAIG